ncbi:MAG: folate-binding protein [Acidobacteriaceae bacterium]|nr:folate-binding protein [Acidobacteriaceae bacterium]
MDPIKHLEPIQAQLAALTTQAGVYPLCQTGWLRATGPDRLRWLAGMLTNGIQQLEPNQGNYNFILNAQGRIQGDAYAFLRADDVLLQTSTDQLQPLLTLLDRFIIMDDVDLVDVSGDWHGISIAGPQSAALLATIGIPADGLAPVALRHITWNGFELALIAAYSPAVPRFELWAGSVQGASALHAALLSAGALDCTPEALEAFRILSGIPLYSIDIRDRDLPQETAQTRALHFSKGCYIGQEIVERIHSRGAVHRTLTGFLIDGDLPAAGTALELDGKPAGEITSTVAAPLVNGVRNFALGYIRREALMQKKLLTYPGGTAEPVELPFAPATKPGAVAS